jgi:tetratricopeptide (TPR) repeat protein
MKKVFLTIFLIVVHFAGFTQSKAPKYVVEVFDNLVNAYGNIKIAPKLEISNPSDLVVAVYTSTPKPTIKIDTKLIKICSSFGQDSLNALSLILSHELAHYYNDHTFCYDFSFANRKSPIAKNLLEISHNSNKEKEIQSDYQGLWYALMAGYNPITIFEKAFKTIYKEYNLPEHIPGYPSKTERIEIKNTVLEKIKKLAPVFQSGLILYRLQKFEEAKNCFELVLQTLPTKENFNNAGLSYLALALSSQMMESIPFVYPLTIDKNSLLFINYSPSGLKGIENDNTAFINSTIDRAKKYFEKAISLNSNYLDAHLNLASLYSSIGNQEAAIGILNTLKPDQQNDERVILIKAIANFKNQNDKNSTLFFNKIKNSGNATLNFNLKLYELANGPKSILNKFLITQRSKDQETNKIAQKPIFDSPDFICQNIENIKICTDYSQTHLIIKIDQENIYCTHLNNTWILAKTTQP